MMRLGRWVKWKDGPSPPAAVFDDYVDDEAESGYWDRAESEDHMQWNSGGLTGPTFDPPYSDKFGRRVDALDRAVGFQYDPVRGELTMHHPRLRKSFLIEHPLLARGSGWRWHIHAAVNLDVFGCELRRLNISLPRQTAGGSSGRGAALGARLSK